MQHISCTCGQVWLAISDLNYHRARFVQYGSICVLAYTKALCTYTEVTFGFCTGPEALILDFVIACHVIWTVK